MVLRAVDFGEEEETSPPPTETQSSDDFYTPIAPRELREAPEPKRSVFGEMRGPPQMQDFYSQVQEETFPDKVQIEKDKESFDPTRALGGALRETAAFVIGGYGSLDEGIGKLVTSTLNKITGQEIGEAPRLNPVFPTIGQVERAIDFVTRDSFKPQNSAEAITAHVVASLLPLGAMKAAGVAVPTSAFLAQGGASLTGEGLRQSGMPGIGTGAEIALSLGLPSALGKVGSVVNARKGARAANVMGTRARPTDVEAMDAAQRLGIEIPVGAQTPRSEAATLERGVAYSGADEPLRTRARTVGHQLEEKAVGAAEGISKAKYVDDLEAGTALQDAARRVSSTDHVGVMYDKAKAHPSASSTIPESKVDEVVDLITKTEEQLSRLPESVTGGGKDYLRRAKDALLRTKRQPGDPYLSGGRRVKGKATPTTQRELIEARQQVRGELNRLYESGHGKKSPSVKALESLEEGITSAMTPSMQQRMARIDKRYSDHKTLVEETGLDKLTRAEKVENIPKLIRSKEGYLKLKRAFADDPEALEALESTRRMIVEREVGNVFRSGEEGVLSFGETANKLSNKRTLQDIEHLLPEGAREQFADIARVSDRMEQYMRGIKIPSGLRVAATFYRMTKYLSPKFWVLKYGMQEGTEKMARLFSDPEFLKEFSDLSRTLAKTPRSPTKSAAKALGRSMEGVLKHLEQAQEEEQEYSRVQ